MWDKLKTAATVCVITGWIWWTADQRVTDQRELTAKLTVRASDPDTYVTIEDPRPIRVTVSGTREQLAKQLSLMQRNPDLPFEYVLPPGESTIAHRRMSAAKMLADTKVFRESGLDIVETRPDEVRLQIDRFETLSMRVEPDFGTVGVENVVCQPPQVQVRRLPSAIVKKKYANPILKPPAEAVLRSWLAAHPDQPGFEIDLTLSIPDAPPALEFSPSAYVKVTGRFVNVLATVKKGPVQIVFAMPPEVERQYWVRPAEGSNFRPDVFVRGPRNKVEPLTPQQIVVFVEVLASDATGTVKTVRRAPKSILPPGIELARDLQEVEFELVDRTSQAELDGRG